MGLRLKVALWVLLLYLIGGGFSLLLLRDQLRTSYGELDREAAVEQLGQLLQALDEQLLQLDLGLRAWSHWDELHRHVLHPDAAFAARNLSPQTVAAAGVSWLAVHRADGSLALQVSAPEAASWGLPESLTPGVLRQLEQANENLRRMKSALGSNALSGNQISSEAGKTALSALLSESLAGDFRPEVARETIKKVMKLG